jgi:serine protease Do
MVMGLMFAGILLVGVGVIYGGLQWVSHMQAKAKEDQFGLPKEYRQQEQARQESFRDYQRAEKIEEEKSKQAFITFITAYVCGGNQTVGSEVAAELNAVGEELNVLRTDADAGNDPSDPRAYWKEHFTRRVAGNQIIAAWLGGKSPAMLTDMIWGRPAGEAQGGSAPDFLIAGSYSSNGTGFFISSDGWVLTNDHVVRYVDTVDIRCVDGVIRQARVVKKDAGSDLALLKCDWTPSSWLTLSTDKIDMGAEVFTIGFPNMTIQGIAPKFTDGRISSLSGFRDDPKGFQISVPVQPGNSGGPLIHFASGTVAGVINARLSGEDADNVSYAIKGEVVRAFLAASSEVKLPVSSGSAGADDAETQIQKTRDAVVLILVK